MSVIEIGHAMEKKVSGCKNIKEVPILDVMILSNTMKHHFVE
jgi:hypothetical protein